MGHLAPIARVAVALALSACADSSSTPASHDARDATTCGEHTCPITATCDDTADTGPTCRCKPGFTGDGTVCVAPSALDCADLTCQANAHCTAASGAALCVCDSGFVPDGATCVRSTQRCADLPPNTCDTNADCIDLLEGYRCTCRAGFVGDGAHCAPEEAPCDPAEDPACVLPCDPAEDANCTPEPLSCGCPDGYAPIPGVHRCGRFVTADVQLPGQGQLLQICAGDSFSSYSDSGVVYTTSWTPQTFEIVQNGWDTGCRQNPTTCLRDATGPFKGYLSAIGVWACPPPGSGARNPQSKWIGFSRCLDLTEPGDYLVGLAGDNQVRLRLDGLDIYQSASPLNFRTWNIGKISLPAGPHVIELFGLNEGAQAAFGAEIYGPFAPGSVDTPAQMRDALGPPPISPELILFSTKNVRPNPPTGVSDNTFQASLDNDAAYSCPHGFALSTCTDVWQCVSLKSLPCSEPAPASP